MDNLWPQVQPLVHASQRPARYLNNEWGCVYKEASFHFCMAYPDTYELGQANQAVRILCNAVNGQEDMYAQRCFLPAADMCDALRSAGLPLFSIEGCNPVGQFDALGITLPHELAATNVCELLDLAGIPLFANDRGEEDIFVLGGGPCAFNPEPFAYYFDAITIGEGEECLIEQLHTIKELKEAGADRSQILRALAKIEGTYVPALYEEVSTEEARSCGYAVKPTVEGVPTVVIKRLFAGFADSSAFEPCIVPFTEVVHDRLTIEILRGCARGCRFCQAGMMYRPVRERSAENIIDSVRIGLKETGYDEVSLTSLSTTDHSQIVQILDTLNREYVDKGVRISIPSQRLDGFGAQMAQLVAGRKKGGLTFAPEAGSQRLRDVINKQVTEEDVRDAISASFSNGWRRCKLYFMVGLPTETDEDMVAIADLAEKALQWGKDALPEGQRKFAQITISLSVFVPKAQTPFQWDPQISTDEVARRVGIVRSSLKHRAITVNWHDPKTSTIEALMSRGGRSMGLVVREAWKNGARFDAWTEMFNPEAWQCAFETFGIEPNVESGRTYDTDDVLPWMHISCGVSLEFLKQERERAEQGLVTPDCTLTSCSQCGVCQHFHLFNQLAATRTEKELK